MPISMPEIMVLTARKPNSHDHMGIIAILLHGEFGWPLSYLVAGSVVVNVEVSVTEIYGVAIVGTVSRCFIVERRKDVCYEVGYGFFNDSPAMILSFMWRRRQSMFRKAENMVQVNEN
jgi:hypothetical protein